MKAFGFILLVAVVSASALAQAPAPSPNPTGAITTIDQDKGATTLQTPTQRQSSSRPGFTPPPMNIKIRDEGIKMPKCAAESRDGEACKK